MAELQSTACACCGHPAEDHARPGQMRSSLPCEHPDCECGDYRATAGPRWVDIDDRLPEPGRWVFVWGNHCREGYRAPRAYRRLETPGHPFWFWSSTEARGSNEIFWWWDGPCEPPAAPPNPMLTPTTPDSRTLDDAPELD